MTNEEIIRNNALAGIAVGIMLGIGIAICIIDDKQSFKIPGTNKVFVRVPYELVDEYEETGLVILPAKGNVYGLQGDEQNGNN